MIRILLVFILPLLSVAAHAYAPHLSFWQRAVSPFFATVDSVGLGATPSNSLASRSVVVGGPGIVGYKAVVITTGTCKSAGVSAALLAASDTPVAIPFSFTPPALTADTYFTVCVIGKTFVGGWQSELEPTSSSTIRVNTVVPTIETLSANNGDTNTSMNSVPVSLSATHTSIDITHFCLKSKTGSTVPSQPAINDSCWKALDGYSPPVLPSQNVNFSNFKFNIGFTQGTFTIYAWVRSASGTISNLSVGTGTVGVDKFVLNYTPSKPPTVINITSTHSDTPSNPIQPSDMLIPAGQSVYIKWKATDEMTLPNDAITIWYTTNESTFTTVVSGIPNAAGAGCTIDSRYTGCFKWTNGSPFSTYYKIRVGVINANGLIAYASAAPNNTTPFSIVAGNTDLGLNGSASAAIIRTRNSLLANNSGQGRFVVRGDSTIYLLDERGLLSISPSDGLLKMFLPINGTATDGDFAQASLRAPIKMALDAAQNLIIYDYNKIRKVDFSTETVSTIVGGGSSTADGTSATNFLINPITGSYEYALFTVLPNGNIWFQTNDDFLRTRANGAKIRIYNAAEQKVYILTPSGIGSLEDPNFDPTNYSIYNFGISYNPITSEVTKIRSRSIIPTSGGHIPRSVSYSPIHGGTEGPHVPWNNYWPDDNTFTSANGEMYNVDHFQNNGIFKYNPDNNSWTRLVGTGVRGQCVDGTNALSCAVDPNDVFVTATGQIYFMDRNQIRVVDSNNTIRTLFGQSLAYGDNLIATSARLSRTFFLDRANDGRIIFTDPSEQRMREFTIGGNMAHVAGTGSEGTPNTTEPASSQSIYANYWGGQYPLVVDPVTADIFYTRDGYQLSRLVRSTGRWTDIAGNGGTSYVNADGMLGSQVAFSGYPMGPQGYNGSQLLRHFHQWNGTTYFESFFKLYSTADGTQTHLAGVTGINLDHWDNCPAGTPVANCKVPSNHNSMSRAQWDYGNGRWLIHQVGSSRVRTATVGGNVGDLVTLPRGIQSFYYVVKSSVPFIYYCSGGRMYKYNLNTSGETTLAWPSSTISCDGYSMAWDPVRSSIVFPIMQNGIGGIAEILDP